MITESKLEEAIRANEQRAVDLTPSCSASARLLAAGWEQAGNMWLDPIMRAIRTEEKSLQCQDMREKCAHEKCTRVGTVNVCIACGTELKPND
jgi:membrane protease subunit (stomatin/prohibitin family)